MGTYKLEAGEFENGKFGQYTLYSHVNNDTCTVIETEARTYVVSFKTIEDTEQLYHQKQEKINKKRGEYLFYAFSIDDYTL